jgi:hypothetical protein
LLHEFHNFHFRCGVYFLRLFCFDLNFVVHSHVVGYRLKWLGSAFFTVYSTLPSLFCFRSRGGP